MDHAAHMVEALQLAEGVLHRTAPNPAVGCVLIRDGVVVGSGASDPAGGPHAEVKALTMAGSKSDGSTAYVSLEPCAHHGRTPPCATALVEAGVARVFVACLDPDPRVNGKGAEMIRSAGIEVNVGLFEPEAKALNRGFFSRTRRGRPWVTFKTALSIDGRTASSSGESQWISGEQSRAEVHRLRGQVDAVLVGAGTARADNPRLTARVAGKPDRVPWRILVTSRCDLPATLNLFADEHAARTIVLAGVQRPLAPEAISRSPIQWIECASDADGRVDLAGGLAQLAAFGINQVLCEAGPALAASLWSAKLIDEVICFRAPIILGGDGHPAWNGLGVEKLNEVEPLVPVRIGASGLDVREHYLSSAGVELIAPAALMNLRQILQAENGEQHGPEQTTK